MKDPDFAPLQPKSSPLASSKISSSFRSILSLDLSKVQPLFDSQSSEDEPELDESDFDAQQFKIGRWRREWREVKVVKEWKHEENEEGKGEGRSKESPMTYNIRSRRKPYFVGLVEA